MSGDSFPEEPVLVDDENEPEFFYSASLRIHGQDMDFGEISEQLALSPTSIHRKGERSGPLSPVYRDDAWHYKSPIHQVRPLEEHILALWGVLKVHTDYLKSLKTRYQVDVFCGYRSNCQTAGIEVDYRCLELFTTLEVPFGLSIIVF